jgi:translation elongation factor P/translation initiation factor 5A
MAARTTFVSVRLKASKSVRLDQKDFQFLYAEGDNLVFMDKETYDQVTLPTDLLGDAAAFPCRTAWM